MMNVIRIIIGLHLVGPVMLCKSGEYVLLVC